MKTGSPPRCRDPALKISGIPQPRRSDVLEKYPIDALIWFPTESIKLRHTQVRARKDLPVHLHFVMTRAKAVSPNFLCGFDLMNGVQVFEEHGDPLAGIQGDAQVRCLEARDIFTNFALQFSDANWFAPYPREGIFQG